jgi:regulatory protein
VTITAIKQQERLKGRYSVYVDGRYAFSLSADALLDAKLYNGQELDTTELKSYKKLSADDKAYGLALSYVARRMRSRWEIGDYFRRKGYELELAEQLLSRLSNLGLIDDAKFAEAWVRNRRLLKPVSRRRLLQELRQKHLADAIIQDALAEDETTDVAVLRELIERKRRISRYQDDQKLLRYLVGQGFSYDDVKNAMRSDFDQEYE